MLIPTPTAPMLSHTMNMYPEIANTTREIDRTSPEIFIRPWFIKKVLKWSARILKPITGSIQRIND